MNKGKVNHIEIRNSRLIDLEVQYEVNETKPNIISHGRKMCPTQPAEKEHGSRAMEAMACYRFRNRNASLVLGSYQRFPSVNSAVPHR